MARTRAGVIPSLGVVLCCAACASQAQPPAPRLVDSGNGSVEVVISGAGRPAVVFESGFSDTYEYWDDVASAVSSRATTVRYNRAGFGRSSLNRKPRTAEQIASELHTTLAGADIASPYVLVGHSAGGMYARVFAHLFPEDVAGLVLVDPAPEAFYDFEALARDDPESWRALQAEMKSLPPGARAQSEVSAASVAQVKAAWPLPNIPVVVISATKLQPPVFTAQRRSEMTTLQRALVQRIPGAEHREAAGCAHNIPGECPTVVSDAVLRILETVAQDGR